MRLTLIPTIPLLPMNSTKLQVLIWTLLVVFTSRTFSNLNYTTISPTANIISPALNRHRRVTSTAGVDDLLPQSEVCKEFVESKVVLKGAKAASPADIFNNLSIGKDFAMTGRKYAKNYVFQSPNYPRKYPNSIECFKLIVAPTQDHRIYLQISQPFAVEPESLCAMDFLEVRDGAFGFSPLIGRFCSRLPPPGNEEIRSTSRYLWLRFRSDGTLPHDGFRAMFHFQKVGDGQEDYEDPRPKMLRRHNVIHLSEDEQWTMRSEFLTKQLDYVNTEERQLPLEAVFDIRSPPETHILLHVHHFQVPLVAAWSCDPEFLAKQKAIKYCDFHSTLGSARTDIFTERSSNIIQVKQYTPSIPDPASYIDGTHTFIEIYTDGKTVSESSPPCPRVDRFCIASVHTDLSDASGSSSSSSASSSDTSSSSDKNGGYGRVRRQFLVQSPRLVARLVVAKPSKPPSSTSEFGHVGVLEDGVDPFETAKTLDIFSMLPNFSFTLTTLSPRSDGVCAPNQRACDEAYCIQTSHWCDGVINCPLGQDEGDAACNPEKAGVVENVEETDTTDMSEKDKAALERAMEEKEDLEKHAAIIGSISLTLVVVTIICMFFAIRRKRKEATHHVIEVKLPSDLDSPHLSGANVNSSNKNTTSSSLHPSKLLPKDVIIDLEDIENEPVFSSSGDALLGREPGSAQKAILGPTSLFANHNWDRKTSPAVTKAFGLGANSKSPSAKSGKSRNALFRHQQIQQQQQQQKAQRGTWQSDVNLIQHSQIHSSRGKLHRGDSAQTADGVPNLRYIQPQLPPRVSNPPPVAVAAKTRQPWSLRQQQQQREEHHNRSRSRSHHHHLHHHRHHHRHRRRRQQQKSPDKDRHQPRQSVFLLRQKTNSTDVPDSSYQEGHVLNCRMLTEQQRTLSLATSRFRLYGSRELTSHGDVFSSSESGSGSSSSLSASSASSSRSTNSSDSSSTSCSSNSTTTTSFCPRKRAPRGYRGYENLMPYSIRLKTFRSMPDVTRATGPATIVSGGGVGGGSSGGGYQFAVSCGHKDCRDYYRLQALRSDLQMERRRPEKLGVEKPALFREREIELTPSSEDDEDGGLQISNIREGGDSKEKAIPLPNPIASDAYSVHGLSDAISVESSKDERSGSEATHSIVTDVSDESPHQSSYTSTNSPISPRPPPRVSSASRPLSSVASLSKRLDSPASSRSRVRVHPAAPNLLVYEYEA